MPRKKTTDRLLALIVRYHRSYQACLFVWRGSLECELVRRDTKVDISCGPAGAARARRVKDKRSAWIWQRVWQIVQV